MSKMMRFASSIVGVACAWLVLSCTGTALAACVEPEVVTIAKGRAPGGASWSMSASIESRKPCKDWTFGFEFASHEFGTTGSGVTVPRGGTRGLEVEAHDQYNRARTAAVFFGYVSANVAELEAEAKNGRTFLVRPRPVDPRRRRGRPWLGDFRYFVLFHSAATLIERATALGPSGKVLETVENRGGPFSFI